MDGPGHVANRFRWMKERGGAKAGPRLGRNMGSFADENVPIRTQKRKSPGRGNDRGKVGIRIRKLRAICAFSNSRTVRFRYRDISALGQTDTRKEGFPQQDNSGRGGYVALPAPEAQSEPTPAPKPPRNRTV
jgi:hypothetical protein